MLTFNPKTNQTEWHKPSRYIEYLRKSSISNGAGKPIRLLSFDNQIINISPGEMSWVDYDGMVYDVTVENHILLVRRGGKKNQRSPLPEQFK